MSIILCLLSQMHTLRYLYISLRILKAAQGFGKSFLKQIKHVGWCGDSCYEVNNVVTGIGIIHIGCHRVCHPACKSSSQGISS